MTDLFANVLELFLDIKFWFKKRKQRRYEKKHGLPKKRMWYPSQYLTIVYLIISASTILLFFFIFLPNREKSQTKEKLKEIVRLLEKEKKYTGVYPNQLLGIIRNDPLRKNIIKDSWGQEFYYELSVDQTSYILFSKGKDQIAHNKDDIKFNDNEK